MILNGNQSSVSRRRFLKQTTAVTVGVACGPGLLDAAAPNKPDEPFVHTVLGPVPNAELGPSLIHEHVMCDFNNYIHDTFVPALEKSGVGQTLVRVLTVDNPARAFGIRRRVRAA
jgi:hypothetical protein